MASFTIRILAVAMAVSLPASEASVAAAALSQLVTHPYLDLLELAPTASFKAQEYEALRKELGRQRQAETERLKKEEKELDGHLEGLRDQLKSLNKEASRDTDAWRAGYDPRGFITFFDKMASEKGYVKSASFFRTHPPFFERILSTVSEIEYLPKTEAVKMDSTDFRQFKQQLGDAVKKESAADKKNKPALRREPECEEQPAAPTSGE